MRENEMMSICAWMLYDLYVLDEELLLLIVDEYIAEEILGV